MPSSVRLDFRACAGAVSADIDVGLVGGWPAQIDAEPRPDVDLVTITIGGNDVIFSDVVQACMLYDDCLSDTFVPRDLDRSRPSIGYPPVQDLEGWAHAAINRVKANLTRVYRNLRETYPNARIVVIGYPYLFHGEPARRSLPDLDCWTVMRRISEGERSGIRSLTDELNEAIVDVINDNRRLRIEFVSTIVAWHRHEPCADWGQYTNAVKPALQLLSPVDGGSFHPNDQGHRQIARLLSCYLNEVARPPVTGARIRNVYGSAEPAADVDEAAAEACDVLLAGDRKADVPTPSASASGTDQRRHPVKSETMQRAPSGRSTRVSAHVPLSRPNVHGPIPSVQRVAAGVKGSRPRHCGKRRCTVARRLAQ